MSDILAVQEAANSESTPPLADCSLERQIELRYANTVNALLADAGEHDSGRILVDVMTWALAKVVVAHKSLWVSGDVVTRLGNHICALSERHQAELDAQAAREEGHLPH